MSNPLDRLRGIDPGLDAPSADSIKARAKKIQSRRNTAWAASAGAATLVVVSALSLLIFRPEPSRQVATELSRVREQKAESAEGASSPAMAQQAADQAAGPEASKDPFSGTSTQRPSSDSAPGAVGAGGTAGVTSQSLRVELELSSNTVTFGQPVTFRLRVCNDSANTVEVEFNTSQRYDFEVTNPSSGNVVWRWSADKAFLQAIGKESYAPGCKIVGEETWNGTNQQGQPLSPGRYDSVGILTSNPPKRSQPKAICVTTCN